MTDINIQPSGHRLPLLVGDVVRTQDGMILMLTASGAPGLVGHSNRHGDFLWKSDCGHGVELPSGAYPANIVEILGGALR